MKPIIKIKNILSAKIADDKAQEVTLLGLWSLSYPPHRDKKEVLQPFGAFDNKSSEKCLLIEICVEQLFWMFKWKENKYQIAALYKCHIAWEVEINIAWFYNLQDI